MSTTSQTIDLKDFKIDYENNSLVSNGLIPPASNFFQLCDVRLRRSSPPILVSLPTLIACHRCGSVMRLGIRKYKIHGIVRELKAYRCGKKGCQTFRSPQTLVYPQASRNACNAKQVKKIFLKKEQQSLKNNEALPHSFFFPWLKVSRFSTSFDLRIVKAIKSK